VVAFASVVDILTGQVASGLDYGGRIFVLRRDVRIIPTLLHDWEDMHDGVIGHNLDTFCVGLSANRVLGIIDYYYALDIKWLERLPLVTFVTVPGIIRTRW
jgi:hypothetical protein